MAGVCPPVRFGPAMTRSPSGETPTPIATPSELTRLTTQLPSLFSSMETSVLPGTAAMAVRPACSKTFAFHPGAKEGAADDAVPGAGAGALAEALGAAASVVVLVAAAALADVVVVAALSPSSLPQPTRASSATPVRAAAAVRVLKLPC